jgi:hypothetical protein
MCGSTKAPKVVKQDPVADQKAADAKATTQANSETALRRRQAAQNSLLTLGAAGTDKLKNTPQTLLSAPSQGTWLPVRNRNPGIKPKMGDMMGAAFTGDFSGLRRGLG